MRSVARTHVAHVCAWRVLPAAGHHDPARAARPPRWPRPNRYFPAEICPRRPREPSPRQTQFYLHVRMIPDNLTTPPCSCLKTPATQLWALPQNLWAVNW
jgi:hypothetical protein